jgi:hypothetical protein
MHVMPSDGILCSCFGVGPWKSRSSQSTEFSSWKKLCRSQALALAGQFAAATMHEVNGPLEAISNLNYLVQTNSDDGEQVRNYSCLLESSLAY